MAFIRNCVSCGCGVKTPAKLPLNSSCRDVGRRPGTFTNVFSWMCLVYAFVQFEKAPEGSAKKTEARAEMMNVLSRRSHIDESVEMVGDLLFGPTNAFELLHRVRPSGLPLVDDWECLKAMVSQSTKARVTLHRLGCCNCSAL